MSKIGKMLKGRDPLLELIFGKDKKKAPPPQVVVAKQGSDAEVAQRRLDTSNRLKSARRIKPIGEEDEFSQRGAKLFGE